MEEKAYKEEEGGGYSEKDIHEKIRHRLSAFIDATMDAAEKEKDYIHYGVVVMVRDSEVDVVAGGQNEGVNLIRSMLTIADLIKERYGIGLKDILSLINACDAEEDAEEAEE